MLEHMHADQRLVVTRLPAATVVLRMQLTTTCTLSTHRKCLPIALYQCILTDLGSAEPRPALCNHNNIVKVHVGSARAKLAVLGQKMMQRLLQVQGCSWLLASISIALGRLPYSECIYS